MTAGSYSDQFASGMYHCCGIYLDEREDELLSKWIEAESYQMFSLDGCFKRLPKFDSCD